MAQRLSRAVRAYTCTECGGPISKGATYLRDEPHPRAKYHRAAVVRYVCANCMSGDVPLIVRIRQAFRNLGGRAHLKDVYKEVRRLGYKRGGEDLNKLIRSEIQKHSRDSRRFTQNTSDDLFHSRKLRSGWWELCEDLARDLEAPTNRTARQAVRVSRIIRDGSLIRELKALHNHCCQLCGECIELPDGRRYSEGHHLQPLGSPHNGPDIRSNVLILCPNHHAMCDLGAIELDSASLRQDEQHRIDAKFVHYHNDVIAVRRPQIPL